MSSTRRITASRANGALSRGPVTPEGKQISSMNGVRHGMLAQTIVLEGECKDRFEFMLASLVAEHQPVTESETALVETMAIARWRQMRVWSIQKADFDREIAQQDRKKGPAPVRAALAFRNLTEQGRSLDVAHRYETSFDRQFGRALRNLHELQSRRPNAAAANESGVAYPSTLTWATWMPEVAEPEEHEKQEREQEQEHQPKALDSSAGVENQEPEKVNFQCEPSPISATPAAGANRSSEAASADMVKTNA